MGWEGWFSARSFFSFRPSLNLLSAFAVEDWWPFVHILCYSGTSFSGIHAPFRIIYVGIQVRRRGRR